MAKLLFVLLSSSLGIACNLVVQYVTIDEELFQRLITTLGKSSKIEIPLL